MNISDIIEIFILAAIILIPCGMFIGRRLAHWKLSVEARFLSPRYLKPITAKDVSRAEQAFAAAADSAQDSSNRPS
jgi:cellulose biosynthesis operon protein BcsF/YhjT